MTTRNRKLNHFPFAPGWLALFLVCAGDNLVLAQNVVLHLKGGDQVSGLIVSEGTNQVVISNAWTSDLSVPLSKIARRETVTNAVTLASAPAPTVKSVARPAAKAVVKPAKPAHLTKLAAATPASSRPAKPRGKWKGQVNIGLDSLFSTKTQQDYFGKLQLTYTRPYASNPKKFFRNTSQFSGQYQRTDGQESANRAGANNKADFDLGTTSYGYCSAGAGFDEVRKIDLKYQLGPGMGSHLIRNDDTALNVESGIDYETQYRRGNDNLESFFLRLAQDWTWKIQKNLKLVEKFEFFPNLEPVDMGQYRIDYASSLSYGFWQNLTLDLTADNSYNTEVASGVQRNEFEVRLTLGATF